MVNVLQRNMSAVIANTSSHRDPEEEESTGFVLQMEELKHNNSAASLSHHKEQKKGQGSELPPSLSSSFVSKTVWQWPPVGRGDGDRAFAFGLRPPCRAQTHRKWAGRRRREGTAGEIAPHCWRREKSQATPAEKAASQKHGCCRGSQTW